MGCRFPLDLRETASHFKGVNRDVVSPNGTFEKPHPSRRTKRDELSHGDQRPEACPIAQRVKNNKASVTPIWTSVYCSLRLLAHMVELTTHEFQHTACYLLFCHLGE